jgi:hypothetical protein
MSAIILVNNPYITLEYRPDEKLIYHTIHQPIGPDQARMLIDTLNVGTDALKKYGASKWLSDDRLNGPLPDELIQWGFADWNARTIAAGWKYWANIVPQQLIAAGTLMPVIEDLHKFGLHMRVFTNVEEGLKWLASV